MKLKPVVASLMMLGLMAPAAFAKVNLASRQAVIDQNSIAMPLCATNWTDRVQVGGKGSIIAQFGNHSPAGTYTDLNNGSDLYVNDFSVALEAKLSSWSKANFVLTYLGQPIPWNNMADDKYGNTEEGNLNRLIRHTVVADEAYVTIGNLAKNPFYLKIGKTYLPFGDYVDPHTPYQIMSPAQMFAQTNAVAAIAGMSTDFGFYGSLYAFKGETAPLNATSGNVRNYGVKLGYFDHLDQFSLPNTKFNLAVSYIRNIWDTDVLSPNAEPQWAWGNWDAGTTNTDTRGVKNFHPSLTYNGTSSVNAYTIEPVGGISAHIDIAYKSFSMSANYTSALEQMLPNDTYSNSSENSRLWGADVNADYSFKTWNHNSSLGAGIQFSGNGGWFSDNNVNGSTIGTLDYARIIPRWRLVGEYKVNIFKNTDLSLIGAYGKSYDFSNVDRAGLDGGERKSALGMARLAVKF